MFYHRDILMDRERNVDKRVERLLRFNRVTNNNPPSSKRRLSTCSRVIPFSPTLSQEARRGGQGAEVSMKIPGWKDADSNWEIGGGLSSFEAPIKLVVQVVRRDGSNESGPPSEENRSARWNSKLSASKLYFYAPPSPIDSKTLTRSNFRVPSTIHLGQLLVRSSLFPSSFQRLNFPWLSTKHSRGLAKRSQAAY